MSLVMMLAEASDSQAWTSRLSLSMPGATWNMVLGLWNLRVVAEGFR
jgi:hypothetical protein